VTARVIIGDVSVRLPLAAAASVVAVTLTALSAAGCARLHARTIGPPLETPAAPPRVIADRQPIDSQPIVTSPPVGAVRTPAPAPAAIRPPDATPPAPSPGPPPVAAERSPAPAPEPPPSLQTTADPAAAEQRTRAALASATRDLGRIDLRGLSADAKAQYDIARRFVTQATSALTARNFEFAEQLANKAATLAALLQRR